MIIRYLLALGASLLMPLAANAETLLERGDYLVNSIAACGNCHTPFGPDAKELSGRLVAKEPVFTAYAPNITQDKETGIGNWTDEQIVTAIRDGKHPSGRTLGPPMPFELYKKVSDNDIKAILAYLRTVKPVANKMPASEYRIPLPENYGPPAKNVADIDRSDKVKYGEYLAGPMGHCIECHTPIVKGHHDFSLLGVGGQEWHGPWGVSVAANITSHKTDGLGKYTDDQIKTIVTTGTRPDGSKMNPPMAYHYYKNINAQDLDAIVAYLRTIPAKATP